MWSVTLRHMSTLALTSLEERRINRSNFLHRKLKARSVTWSEICELIKLDGKLAETFVTGSWIEGSKLRRLTTKVHLTAQTVATERRMVNKFLDDLLDALVACTLQIYPYSPNVRPKVNATDRSLHQKSGLPARSKANT